MDDSDSSTSVDIEPPECVPGPEMVCIPRGDFVRGTSEIDGGDPDEAPVREVFLDAFKIDRVEVSAALYAECMLDGPCTERIASVGPKEECTTIGVHPANCVTWQQAATFCEWDGKRLPTEAEWERAARGTDGALYPWGVQDPSCELALFDGDDDSCDGTPAAPVGDRSPAGDSPDGVSDMAGNVFEWTADWYAANAYSEGPLENPVGPEMGEEKIIRGGSYASPPGDLRGARRVHIVGTTSSAAIGFRCARSSP